MIDPIAKFIEWLDEASARPDIIEPSAMTVATCDKKGRPSARIVLLRGIDQRGFVFYTNFESRKSLELKENPHAALCFYWELLFKQVRVEGPVAPVADDEADAYFISRPREHQISAWASKQSQPLEGAKKLAEEMEKRQQEFGESGIVPRPAHWSGWRLTPESIEFWQQRDFRLHDREVFRRKGEGWSAGRLYP